MNDLLSAKVSFTVAKLVSSPHQPRRFTWHRGRTEGKPLTVQIVRDRKRSVKFLLFEIAKVVRFTLVRYVK